MRSLVILHSGPSGHTRRLAQAIAGELEAEVVDVEAFSPGTLQGYGLVGFGSGVYRGRLDESLHRLVERLPAHHGTRAFIFSTSGTPAPEYHASLRDLLRSRGFDVVAEHTCPGEDTYRFQGTTLNPNCPNPGNLEAARRFARELKQKLATTPV